MSSFGSASIPVRDLPQNDRTREMLEMFAARYQKKPDFFVRVPGRVNLIGEHVDYCGYSVCPMALEQDILLAVSTEDDKMLHLYNLDKKFEEFQCDLRNFEISSGEGAPQWHQYFICGVKGILEVLPKDVELKGMNILVSGTIPQSAGLSSSSALVSAAALATSHAHKQKDDGCYVLVKKYAKTIIKIMESKFFQNPLSKEKLANLCAECERYIGTQGGGMDQAIAFLATEGCAKLIEFSPLRSTDITLPEGAVFVIAHSLTNLNKAATADFNCRVIECRLAAQLMAKDRGLQWTKIKRLGDLQKALGLDLQAMISLVEETLHERPYTKEEVVEELETTDESLAETSLTQNTNHIRSFKLRERALHVFREALRVEHFVEACSRPPGAATLATLGQLMSESHASLRDFYECSHPQLDRLVEMSSEHTLGTRLTGAGWGGCTVSLLSPDKVDEYVKFLKEKFYKPLGVEDGFGAVVFATSPKGGACVYI